MKQTEEHVVAKLARITGSIGAIDKERKKNSQLNYGYQGIDDVINELSPLIAKEGIFVSINVLHKEVEKNADGKSITAIVDCEIVFTDGSTTVSTQESAIKRDFGDKAVTQAISMCYKYALIRTFFVRTKGELDPDENHIQHDTAKVAMPIPLSEKQQKEVFMSELKKVGITDRFMALTPKGMSEKFNEWLHMKPELKSDYIAELKSQLTLQK